MKYALILFLVLGFSLACALEVSPGSGSRVWPGDLREYEFHYHGGTDDYHFFGSDLWAVRFNFAEIYPENYASSFEVTKALLWLPQTGDSVRVELFSEAYGGPGASLAWAKVPVTSNQLEIPFDEPVQGDSLWLVVSYATNFANRFVAASSGGGEHSYYWNTNSINPYFQNLATAGFNAELLFGLAGNFLLNAPDLELLDFELEGDLRPRQLVGPTFSIYNHTDLTLSDTQVYLNVYSPSPDFARADTILISEPIPPRSQYTFNSQSPGYEDHRFSLPDQPMQLKLRAVLDTLNVPPLPVEPVGNNRITIHRFSLNDEYPVHLVENFLRTDSSVQISATQDPYAFPDVHILHYFPVLSDSLANVPAQIRFNWYNFNSLPRTAINGDLRLNGFFPDYGSQYEQLCLQTLDHRSFVSSSNCRFEHIPQNDMLTAELTLANASTLLYTAATEYNLVNDTRLSIGLFKKVLFDGAERWVIERWITHSSMLSGPLGAGEELSLNFNLSLSNLTLAELAQNYRLYYWLQQADRGPILYSAYGDFTNVVAIQEEVLPVPVLRVWPNPLSGNGSLTVSLEKGWQMGSLAIYNLRGQKIRAEDRPGTEFSLRTQDFPASGIYLLRVSVPQPQGGNTFINKKINIMK